MNSNTGNFSPFLVPYIFGYANQKIIGRKIRQMTPSKGEKMHVFQTTKGQNVSFEGKNLKKSFSDLQWLGYIMNVQILYIYSASVIYQVRVVLCYIRIGIHYKFKLKILHSRWWQKLFVIKPRQYFKLNTLLNSKQFYVVLNHWFQQCVLIF